MDRRQSFGEQTRLEFSAGRAFIAAVLLLIAAVALLACGEATDQPEDCRPGEYFNEANESCDACPAVTEPQCREGCGFEIVEPEDRAGLACPIAECSESGVCDSGLFFDDETLSCESCEGAPNPPAICAESVSCAE